MTASPALTVPPEAAREAVAALLVSHGIASAPVVDRDGHLLGVVDETDLVRGGSQTDAGALMRRDAVPVDPETPLSELVARMLDAASRALVVVDEGVVVGVVSRRDVLRRVASGELAAWSGAPGESIDGASSKTIVVGVDGSAPSVEALRWAFREARRHGAGLRAVSAYDFLDLYEPIAAVEQRARSLLSDTVTSALGDTPAGVAQETHQGHPVRVLLDAAADAELLVIGARGAGGFPGMQVGSVGVHLTGHAPCPMVIVPYRPPAVS